jgi:L-iditol 2-dehydrogenase
MTLPRDAVSSGNLVRLPPGLDERVAALTEPLSCVVNGIRLSNPTPGAPVLIIGAGPVGQMFLMMIRDRTDEVFVVEPDPLRGEFARAHGAKDVFLPGSDGLPRADTIIVACSSPDAYSTALRNAPAGATINLFGGLAQGVMIDSNHIHYRELHVHGTSGSTPGQFAQAMSALAAKPRLADIITHVVAFQQLGDVLRPTADSGALSLKMVLDPWMDQEATSP